MRTIVKFDRRYDVGRLRADLDVALRAGKEYLHFGTYHDGGWTAIPLISVGGVSDASALPWAGWRADYRPTQVLEDCSYFREIIDEFRCPKQRVRLLRLAPGTNIHEHADEGDGWAVGKVRLHIPIITHPEVYFYVDGYRVIMKPGELWYCDFTRPHRVHNRSDVNRVHLVLDLVVDDWLRALFPPETVPERIRNLAQLGVLRGRSFAYGVAHRAGMSGIRNKVRTAISSGRDRLLG